MGVVHFFDLSKHLSGLQVGTYNTAKIKVIKSNNGQFPIVATWRKEDDPSESRWGKWPKTLKTDDKKKGSGEKNTFASIFVSNPFFLLLLSSHLLIFLSVVHSRLFFLAASGIVLRFQYYRAYIQPTYCILLDENKYTLIT